jgi:hypothetical protein
MEQTNVAHEHGRSNVAIEDQLLSKLVESGTLVQISKFESKYLLYNTVFNT